ncbi:MAG TPA: ABC transporter ATP-binding protein, partial [Acidimicrobiales bacterium]|nr:ABC transporter ATP-binding protein [Acidimicrobiales bacterium]
RQAAAELSAIRLDEALGAVYTTLLSSGVLFVIWFGGQRVAAGSLSVGGLVAFLQLFVRFIGRAPRIPLMANRIQAAAAAYGRLRPMIVDPPPFAAEPRWSTFSAVHVGGSVTPVPSPEPGDRAPAALSFERVTFTYPNASRPAIVDLDLQVAAGSLVAVTGPVGCGKSALARLAAGVYPPDAGEVLLDGLPVSEIPAPSRARRVGYLGQEPHLFSATIAENLTLSPGIGAGPQEGPHLARAAGLALLGPDLARMSDGLATEVGELGVRVSGGQRQRIALARALAAGGGVPGLLVLDDPFSAVDVDTEAAITAALRASLGVDAPASERATILLFSHRLAAFPYADEVVVLDGGRIEERGTHAALVEQDGLYARIYRAQHRLDQPERRP